MGIIPIRRGCRTKVSDSSHYLKPEAVCGTVVSHWQHLPHHHRQAPARP